MRNGLGVVLAGWAATMAAPAAAQSCPADPALAMLVSASDQIVVGRIEISPDLPARFGRKPFSYLDLPVTVTRTLRGDGRTRITVRFYPDEAPYHPSNAAVLASGTTPSLFFLVHAEGGVYFAGTSPAALQSANAADAAIVEIARQNAVLKHWRADPLLPHYREVQDLIARLGTVRGDAQQHIFDRLVGLGKDAVPAIVAQMDDRRALLDDRMTLKNSAPDSFEATRQYGPERVVDALSAILNQIIGESFVAIENGGSDADRDADVAGWRIYAAGIGCPRQ